MVQMRTRDSIVNRIQYLLTEFLAAALHKVQFFGLVDRVVGLILEVVGKMADRLVVIRVDTGVLGFHLLDLVETPLGERLMKRDLLLGGAQTKTDPLAHPFKVI